MNFLFAFGLIPSPSPSQGLICSVKERLKTLPHGSQSALASELRITPQMLSNYLALQLQPAPMIIFKLQEWLDRPINPE